MSNIFCVNFVTVILSRQINISRQSCNCCSYALSLCNVIDETTMVTVLVLSLVDRGFERRSDQAKDYKIVICCFSSNHAALKRKNGDWLAQNQDNVSD